MQGDWTNEFTLKFLHHYANEKLLWDTGDKNHKIKYKLHEAWKRISEKMGNIPIDQLKSKKKSLMATFRPLFKKKKASMMIEADADDVFQPVWFAYDFMESFLARVYDTDDAFKMEDQIHEIKCENTSLPPPSPSISIHSQQSEISEPPDTPDTTRIPSATKIDHRHRSTKNIDISMIDVQRRMNESSNAVNNALIRKREEEDECDLYAQLLAKKLRKYPGRMRYMIMYKIDGLLLDNLPDD